MPLYYLDTSGLLKRYVLEVGSEWMISLIRTEPVSISVLSMAEVASALGRRYREDLLSARQRDALYRRFVDESERYMLVGLTRAVVEQAAALLIDPLAPPRLRTLDALHIASARIAFERALRQHRAVGAFVSADRALLRAAEWAGLATANPEDHP